MSKTDWRREGKRQGGKVKGGERERERVGDQNGEKMVALRNMGQRPYGVQ